MLKPAADYDSLVGSFRWQVPERYNIASTCCVQWAELSPERVAIITVQDSGAVETLTYGALHERSSRLANALKAQGVQRGDRIAIMLPQGPIVPVAHMAIYKLGAIAVPLAVLFGVDAISYRIRDAAISVIITNAAGVEKVKAANVEARPLILSTDGADAGALDIEGLIAAASAECITCDTDSDDPALMIYTSGTTGHPKGALHAHRVLLGHLPGVQFPHDFLPQPDDRLWTPADWAWAGGLLNILLPGLHFGVPVVARKFPKFDPEEALSLMVAQKVRNTFIPPTALRMLRSAPVHHFPLNLRTLASGGEALGEETFAWGREALGLTINEFYGQTECNLIVGSQAKLGVSRAGSMGKPIPGHDVRIIRADGTLAATGELGQIAVRSPDPVMFLSYWNRPEATQEKFIGDWMLTGDQGSLDADGYIHFVGRDDDVITSSGYRIGPGEIEDCLIQHEAVLLAAAVGKPDKMRTEIIKAFVVLRPGYSESEELRQSIQSFVRARLSAHEYPREIAFIAEMPLTTTGKVIRRLLRDQA